MDAQRPHEPEGWPAAWASALDDDALKAASSLAVFRRSQEYVQSDAVEVTGEDFLPEPALRANVIGSQLYTTEVWIEDDEIAGHCSCPNADDGWFCKHQVALAIVWRERRSGLRDSAVASPPRARSSSLPAPQSDRENRAELHRFLSQLDRAVIVDKLIELSQRDHRLERELQHWRQLVEEGDDPEQLKAAISDQLDPGTDYLSLGEGSAYTFRAKAVLPILQRLRLSRSVHAIDMCVHALRKGWAALNQADDSDGAIGDLCSSIGTELVAALQTCGPPKAAFGNLYLELQLEEIFPCWDVDQAEAAMGTAALSRYRQTLAERWQATKQAVRDEQQRRAERIAAVAHQPRKVQKIQYEHQDRSTELLLTTLESLHLRQMRLNGDDDGVMLSSGSPRFQCNK